MLDTDRHESIPVSSIEESLEEDYKLPSITAATVPATRLIPIPLSNLFAVLDVESPARDSPSPVSSEATPEGVIAATLPDSPLDTKGETVSDDQQTSELEDRREGRLTGSPTTPAPSTAPSTAPDSPTSTTTFTTNGLPVTPPASDIQIEDDTPRAPKARKARFSRPVSSLGLTLGEPTPNVDESVNSPVVVTEEEEEDVFNASPAVPVAPTNDPEGEPHPRPHVPSESVKARIRSRRNVNKMKKKKRMQAAKIIRALAPTPSVHSEESEDESESQDGCGCASQVAGIVKDIFGRLPVSSGGLISGGFPSFFASADTHKPKAAEAVNTWCTNPDEFRSDPRVTRVEPSMRITWVNLAYALAFMGDEPIDRTIVDGFVHGLGRIAHQHQVLVMPSSYWETLRQRWPHNVTKDEQDALRIEVSRKRVAR